MFREAPLLETERLVLRAHRIEDLEDCLKLWTDPVVLKQLGSGSIPTREIVWTKLLRYAGLWSLLGYGYWTLRERTSGQFIGEVGLADFHRDVVPSLDGVPESGWALGSWAHGKGFATEALQAVLSWSREQLEVQRSVCLIAPDNVASLRVAEKCGYVLHSRVRYKEAELCLLDRCV